MTLDAIDPPGATPLTDEEMEGLIPSDIATRGDLNEAELENIVAARIWAATRTWTTERLLAETTLKALHRRMFGDVWRWAGTFRKRQTNLGVAPLAIPLDLRTLLDGTRAWIEFGTYDQDETALRFHPPARVDPRVPERQRPARPVLRRPARARVGTADVHVGRLA